MKFLCDRCKTRYSIGDDRVRGKILKIRCKNCANVITVREGMDADAGADAPGRSKKNTTMAPLPVESAASATGSQSALGQAFASAMTKPPPALEEEWYVSIDGDQSGPFSLAEAQRWVSSKPADADLHCWSEGFDDWLPVDKVSHFRGLRKKAAPPPLPRLGGTGPSPRPNATTSSGPQVQVKPAEDEPKPLFAATMASLEKAAAANEPTSRGVGLGNGTGAGPSPMAARGNLPAPARPLVPNGAKPNGAGRAPAPAPANPVFDSGDLDGATTIEPAPFTDEAMTAAEPVAAAAKQSNDAFAKALGSPAKPSPDVKTSAPLFGASTPASAPVPLSALGKMPSGPTPSKDFGSDGSVEGDGLDIGEVSRVVKLADIVRNSTKPNPALRRSQPGINQTGAIGRVTGPTPRIAGTGAAPSITSPGVDPSQLIGADGLPVPLPLGADESQAGALHANAPISHKRGMIMLIAGAVALIGILLVVVLVVNNSEDDGPTYIAQYTEIDTTGREIVITINKDGTETAIDKATGQVVQKPIKRPQVPNTPIIPTRPPEPTGLPLSGSDIEAMAAKYNNNSATCWRRSMKGTEDIVLSDVKKFQIVLAIAKDGSVGSVDYRGLPKGTNLEKCLSGFIKTWKFRPNAGGSFAFTMLRPG